MPISTITSKSTTGVISSGTAVASTSGTSIDFTGIPSWVKRITVMLSGVSSNGTSNWLVQIGSGSFTSSGYTSTFMNGDGPTVYTSTAGFLTSNWLGSTALNRNFVCSLVNVTGNTWLFSVVGHVETSTSGSGAGRLALGGTLDRVRITTVNGTDTFDAGTINILYE